MNFKSFFSWALFFISFVISTNSAWTSWELLVHTAVCISVSIVTVREDEIAVLSWFSFSVTYVAFVLKKLFVVIVPIKSFFSESSIDFWVKSVPLISVNTLTWLDSESKEITK